MRTILATLLLLLASASFGLDGQVGPTSSGSISIGIYVPFRHDIPTFITDVEDEPWIETCSNPRVDCEVEKGDDAIIVIIRPI